MVITNEKWFNNEDGEQASAMADWTWCAGSPRSSASANLNDRPAHARVAARDDNLPKVVIARRRRRNELSS
jgi:hypothetical protein